MTYAVAFLLGLLTGCAAGVTGFAAWTARHIWEEPEPQRAQEQDQL